LNPLAVELLVDTRRIDDLGRLVIPMTARVLFGWRPHDTLRVLVDPAGRVILEREPAGTPTRQPGAHA
jgi:AbrB family looped-hinge helix DNA binding protein